MLRSRRKRDHAEGAALFWMLAAQRRSHGCCGCSSPTDDPGDFLDNVSEREADAAEQRLASLHLALIEALDPRRADLRLLQPSSLEGRWRLSARARGGMPRRCARAAVLCVRAPACSCAWRPSRSPAPQPRPRSPQRRDAALRDWAETDFPRGGEQSPGLSSAAAASACSRPHALLALAAEPACRRASHRRHLCRLLPVGVALRSRCWTATPTARGRRQRRSQLHSPLRRRRCRRGAPVRDRRARRRARCAVCQTAIATR